MGTSTAHLPPRVIIPPIDVDNPGLPPLPGLVESAHKIPLVVLKRASPQAKCGSDMLRAREPITYETGVEIGENFVVRASGSLGSVVGAQAPHNTTLSSSIGAISLSDPRDLRYVVSRLLPNLEKKMRKTQMAGIFRQ